MYTVAIYSNIINGEYIHTIINLDKTNTAAVIIIVTRGSETGWLQCTQFLRNRSSSRAIYSQNYCSDFAMPTRPLN